MPVARQAGLFVSVAEAPVESILKLFASQAWHSRGDGSGNRLRKYSFVNALVYRECGYRDRLQPDESAIQRALRYTERTATKETGT